MRIARQTLNRFNVLRTIRRHAPGSGSHLEALAGLSSGTITKVAGDLVGRRILSEAKAKARRTAGRPRTYLQINPPGAMWGLPIFRLETHV